MKNAERLFYAVILLAFIYYSQFYKLGSMAFRIWDESRLATNAYEMTQTGNILVTTIGYEPENWNTKPPLMIWAQAICIKLHGINEYSVRFPSAIAAALTTLLVYLFTFYITKNKLASLTSAIVLCTSQGYIGYHGTRYGEFDSMLTLFTTAMVTSLFCYCEEKSPERKDRILLLFFVVTCLGLLTKGVAALLFAPALFIYLIIRKHLLIVLKSPSFYMGSIGLITVVFGYYFLREHYSPGYLKAVYDNELGGRFLKLTETHNEPFAFYFSNIVNDRFKTWFWIIPTAFILLFFQGNGTRLRTSIFLFLNAGMYLLIISISKTKLPWYDMPVYPLLAIIAAITMLQITRIVQTILPDFNKKMIAIGLCFALCALPVKGTYQMIKYAADELYKDDYYAVSYYLRDNVYGNNELSNATYFFTDYAWQWKLYIYRLHEKGYPLQTASFDGTNHFEKNQIVITHQKPTKEYIEANYNNEVMYDYYGVKLYKIINIKK